MNFYRRYLPHWQPHGAEYFVTFRLAGSLPREMVNRLKSERKKQRENNRKSPKPDREFKIEEAILKRVFKKYDQLLDKSIYGPTWLVKTEIADIVKEALHYRDSSAYDLYAYCVMPNHVHMVFKLPDPKSINPEENADFPVTRILKSLKWFTALKANRVLQRTGNSFWQPESYDHVIRDSGELERIIYYTLQNPVKAGFVSHWQKWPHSYCKSDYLELFE